jgi:hypothetical protein
LSTGLSVTPAEALVCPIRIPIAALAIVALVMKSRRFIGLPSTLEERGSVQRPKGTLVINSTLKEA